MLGEILGPELVAESMRVPEKGCPTHLRSNSQSVLLAAAAAKKARKPATLKMRVTQQPRKQGKTTFEVYSDYIALAMPADNV